MERKEYKLQLINNLRERGYLWSYAKDISVFDITCMDEDILIEKSLIFLEFEELPEIISFFGYDRVKEVWKRKILPQGKYLETINWLLAVLFFNEENPYKLISDYGKLERRFDR